MMYSVLMSFGICVRLFFDVFDCFCCGRCLCVLFVFVCSLFVCVFLWCVLFVLSCVEYGVFGACGSCVSLVCYVCFCVLVFLGLTSCHIVFVDILVWFAIHVLLVLCCV